MALVILSGANALAQTDTSRQASTDVTVVEQCIASAQDDVARAGCIGRISRPCIDAPDGSGSSTLGMNVCYGREIAAWDTLLNRIYKVASAATDEAGRTYLRDAQRVWLSFRQKACDWPAQFYPGGTIRGPLGGECMQIQTARRVLDLDQIRMWLSDH